jgi:GTPase SAR1 family protein
MHVCSAYVLADFLAGTIDTAGQERFRAMSHAYYRNAHGESNDSCLAHVDYALLKRCAFLLSYLAIVIVFDLGRRASLQNVRQWHQEALLQLPEKEDIIIILAGNKADMVVCF